MNYAEYIEIDPEKRFGRPILIGTRISVYDVLSWLSEGMTFDDIISDFPEINENQLKACLSYAADKEHKLRVVS